MELLGDKALVPHTLPRWQLPKLDEDDELFLLTIPEGLDPLKLPVELLLPTETDSPVEVVKDGLVYTASTEPTSGTKALLFNPGGKQDVLHPKVLETTTTIAVMPVLTPTEKTPVEYPKPAYSWPGVEEEELIYEQKDPVPINKHVSKHRERSKK